MDTPIRMPFPERRRDNLQVARTPMPNGAITFGARSFVRLSGTAPDQVLIAVAAAEVTCYGWCPDRSHAFTETPPDALYKDPHAIAGVYNYLHWPFSCQDTIFVMNTTGATGQVGTAQSAPALSLASVGQLCLIRTATVNGVVYQMLDIVTAGTGATAFAKIVGLVPGQSLADLNGLVYAEVLASVIEVSPTS